MRAVNHVVTGALIATYVHQPILAVPLALLSHVVLDAVPHYSDDRQAYNSRDFLIELAIDIGLSLLVLLALLFSGSSQAWLLVVCGIVGAVPDLIWFEKFIRSYLYQPVKWFKPEYKPIQFLSKVQWCERRWGIFVEIPWLVVTSILLFSRI